MLSDRVVILWARISAAVLLGIEAPGWVNWQRASGSEPVEMYEGRMRKVASRREGQVEELMRDFRGDDELKKSGSAAECGSQASNL